MTKRRIMSWTAVLVILFSIGVSWDRFVRPALAQNIRGTIVVPVTITAGNTFQTILNAGAKFGIEIQNNNTTDNCWVTYGTLANGTKITAGNATTATAEILLPGGSFMRYSGVSYVPSDEFEATCASTSDTLAVRYQ